MNIFVLGRGNVGGGLARRWERAGHAVTAVGRDGGDATDAEVIVVAVPSGQIADALSKVVGLRTSLPLVRRVVGLEDLNLRPHSNQLTAGNRCALWAGRARP